MEKQVLLKLGIDKRSASFILANEELCKRIIDESPININEFCKKYNVSKTTVNNWIVKGIISSFRNSPNQGSNVFVFENEITALTPIYDGRGLAHYLNDIIMYSFEISKPILSDRQIEFLDSFFKNHNSISKIAEDAGITRERVRQILYKAVTRVKNKMQRLDEIEQLENRITQLKDEIAYLEHHKKLNESVVKLSKPISKEVGILNKPIEDFELSVRCFNCLKAARINTLLDLAQFDLNDLLRFRNFGKRSLDEIKSLIIHLDLQKHFTRLHL